MLLFCDVVIITRGRLIRWVREKEITKVGTKVVVVVGVGGRGLAGVGGGGGVMPVQTTRETIHVDDQDNCCYNDYPTTTV